MATQETIKQMFSGGVLRDVEDVTARQMVAALQNAIDALTSGDTTTAIETFQEVIDFLSGVTDDETLVGKLNELRTLINAKYTKPAGGIPASDLASGVIPDVSGFATKTEVNAKANSADVYTKSQTDAAIADALDDLPTGSVESVTVNGTKHTPDTQGDVNLGTIQGEKGDKGDTGNVEITDAGDMVALIVNDLTTGGAGNFLSAEMGKRLKQNVDAVQANIVKLYNKLANMAFWDAEDKAAAEPTELDWSIPKHLLTVTNNNANAKVYRDDAEVTVPLNIEENATVELIVAPVGDHIVTGVTPSTGTATDLGDGTFKVVLTMGNTDIALTLTVTTIAAYQITVNTSNCTASGATRIAAGSTATINLAAAQGYELPSAASGITISGATVSSYTPSQDLSTAVLVIGNATGAVTIGVTASQIVVWEDCPIVNIEEGGSVVRYAMARGTIYPTNGMTYTSEDQSSNIIVSPKHETSGDRKQASAAGTSAPYFFPTEGHSKVRIKAKFPQALSGKLPTINIADYTDTFTFIKRDTYQPFSNEDDVAEFTLPSNAAYIKILFGIQNGTAADGNALLANLQDAEFKYFLTD